MSKGSCVTSNTGTVDGHRRLKFVSEPPFWRGRFEYDTRAETLAECVETTLMAFVFHTNHIFSA